MIDVWIQRTIRLLGRRLKYRCIGLRQRPLLLIWDCCSGHRKVAWWLRDLYGQQP
jgi:hypothetical protein